VSGAAGRAAAAPDLEVVLRGFPHARTRGEVRDAIAFHAHKLLDRFAHRVRGRRRRPPHPVLLRAAVAQVLRVFPEPVCVETGCIRSAAEETRSTLAIASALVRGRLYTFELDPRHIALCREICREVDDRITYVQGDAKVELRRWADRWPAVHLAFLDSRNDADQIWEEFRALEDRFVPGSLLVVDDVVPPSRKGLRVKPYLHAHPGWQTRLVYAGRGLLVAQRLGGAGEGSRAGAPGRAEVGA
jgi:hypothetical protein